MGPETRLERFRHQHAEAVKYLAGRISLLAVFTVMFWLGWDMSGIEAPLLGRYLMVLGLAGIVWTMAPFVETGIRLWLTAAVAFITALVLWFGFSDSVQPENSTPQVSSPAGTAESLDTKIALAATRPWVAVTPVTVNDTGRYLVIEERENGFDLRFVLEIENTGSTPANEIRLNPSVYYVQDGVNPPRSVSYGEPFALAKSEKMFLEVVFRNTRRADCPLTAHELFLRAAEDEDARVSMNLTLEYRDTIEPDSLRETWFSYLITRTSAQTLESSKMN